MATAEEILAAEVEECDDILTVDLDSRVINIPNNVTNIGVESDENVRKLHFRVPRYYCDVDLSTFVIRINYLNARKGGDVYDVMSSEVIDDVIHFDWEVGRNAFAYKGDVHFIVCLKDVDAEGNVLREFNTTIATLPVLQGLETGEAIVNEYYDLLEQWKASLFGAGDTIEQQIKDTGAEVMSQVATSGDSYLQQIADTGAAEEQKVKDAGVEALGNISGIEQQIKDVGDSYLQQIADTGDAEEQQVKDAGDEAIRQIESTADTSEQRIDDVTSAAVQQIEDTANSSKQNIVNTGDSEEQQVRDTGDEVIANVRTSVETFISEHSDELTGPRGFTFTPSVDDDSNISWTNDGGLPNPATKNIKGDKGDPFTYSDFTDEQLKALIGPKGDKGDPFTYDMFTDEQLAALVGPKGDKGTSITSIDRTSGTGAAGTTDTYTITLSDGSTHSFYVYNGADGDGAGDMMTTVYDPQGRKTDIFDYVDKKIGELTVVNAETFNSLVEQGG